MSKTVRFLLNDEMARAIVEGRKTVTRRPMKVQPLDLRGPPHPGESDAPYMWCDGVDGVRWKPLYGPCAPGDMLIGRECFQAWTGGEMSGYEEAEGRLDFDFEAYSFTYRADGDCSPKRWRPSIHMPDAAARIRHRVIAADLLKRAGWSVVLDGRML